MPEWFQFPLPARQYPGAPNHRISGGFSCLSFFAGRTGGCTLCGRSSHANSQVSFCAPFAAGKQRLNRRFQSCIPVAADGLAAVFAADFGHCGFTFVPLYAFFGVMPVPELLVVAPAAAERL